MIDLNKGQKKTAIFVGCLLIFAALMTLFPVLMNNRRLNSIGKTCDKSFSELPIGFFVVEQKKFCDKLENSEGKVRYTVAYLVAGNGSYDELEAYVKALPKDKGEWYIYSQYDCKVPEASHTSYTYKVDGNSSFYTVMYISNVAVWENDMRF